MLKLKLTDSLNKIQCNTKTVREARSGSMLIGELYHFGFVVTNDSWATSSYKLKIEAPKDIKLTAWQVKDVPVGKAYTSKEHDDYYISNGNTLLPDLLHEFDENNIIFRNGNTFFFIEAEYISEKVPKKPKRHRITVSLINEESGEEECLKAFTLSVIPVKLKKTDLVVTNWIHYDCISDKHDVEVFSDEFYNVCREYFKTAVKYGQTALLTPIFTFPLDTKVGTERKSFQLVGVKLFLGQYSFDFSKLEKFIDTAFECGIKYIEFSHLFSQWGAKYMPKVHLTNEGKEETIPSWKHESDSPLYMSFLDSFLPKLVQFINEKGIKDRVFFHISDEPSLENFELYKKNSEFVKRRIDGIPTMDAMSEYKFYEEGATDLPAVLISNTDEFVKNSVKHLVYCCCVPQNGYYSNKFIAMPSERTRILGMQMYKNKASGFLHWGFNFYNSSLSLYPIDPYLTTDADGVFPSGDAFSVYPKKNGCDPSLRLPVFYDGLQDLFALKMLEELSSRAFVISLLEENGMFGYNKYPRSPKKLLKLRKDVNTLIYKLSKTDPEEKENLI